MLFCVCPLLSQHTIHLRNGKKISGNIKNQNINFVLLQSNRDGKLHRLPKRKIRKIMFSYKKKSSRISRKQNVRHSYKRKSGNTEKSLMRIRKLQAKQRELREERERNRNLQQLFIEKNRLKEANRNTGEEDPGSENEEYYYEDDAPQKMLTHNQKPNGTNSRKPRR